MLSDNYLPTSLQILLNRFRLGFTAPTFATFSALVRGFIGCVGEHNVCAMLTGAGLAETWHHSRAHRFFSRRRWSADWLGLQFAGLLVERLVPRDAALVVAVDGTLFRRWGRKVFGARWAHDGSAATRRAVSFGNTWVVAGLVVPVPLCRRPFCFPVLFRLWQEGSKVVIARDLVERLAAHFPDRQLHVVGDAEYLSRDLRGLPDRITWSGRPRANAVFHDLTPPRTGRRGRPRARGDRLPSLSGLAASLDWSPHHVTRYGSSDTIAVASRRVLWYHAFGPQVMRLILVRPVSASGKEYEIAIITTDLAGSLDDVIERYASRWSIEVAFEDAKGITGVGEARNRTEKAVLRTVPFGFISQGLLTVWYLTDLHDDTVVADRRRHAPWYRTKRTPSLFDMVVAARRVLIANSISRESATHPDPHQLAAAVRAWEIAVA